MLKVIWTAIALLWLVTPAGAVGSSDYSTPTLGVLQAANQLLQQKKYADAYQKLKYTSGAPEDDRQNLLGFSARKQGKFEIAAQHYKQALAINPRHLGALEYQGELFLELGQIKKAQENLSKLMQYCGSDCDETKALRKAIGKALQ